MRIFIRTLSQHNYSVDVAPTDTILRVKEKFYDVSKEIVPTEQKLIYQHQQMCDTCTVSEYMLTEGTTLFVVNSIFEKR